jgi:AcrR family transcriptional regulator
MASQPAMRRPRGRPRQRSVATVLLQTALQLLVEGRFFGMSMEEIAEAAGTTKPTVYLRYRTKTELALAALDALPRQRPPLVLAGELRADLIALLQDIRANVTRYSGMLGTGVVLVHEQDRPEWLQFLQQGVFGARRRAFRNVILGAIERGEARADADVDTCVSLLVGYWHASYYHHFPAIPDENWAERAVDVLLCYLRPAP